MPALLPMTFSSLAVTMKSAGMKIWRVCTVGGQASSAPHNGWIRAGEAAVSPVPISEFIMDSWSKFERLLTEIELAYRIAATTGAVQLGHLASQPFWQCHTYRPSFDHLWQLRLYLCVNYPLFVALCWEMWFPKARRAERLFRGLSEVNLWHIWKVGPGMNM